MLQVLESLQIRELVCLTQFSCSSMIIPKNFMDRTRSKIVDSRTILHGGGFLAEGLKTLDVLYAIHQLTITFVTYIFKITSLTFLFFRRARKKVFLYKIK